MDTPDFVRGNMNAFACGNPLPTAKEPAHKLLPKPSKRCLRLYPSESHDIFLVGYNWFGSQFFHRLSALDVKNSTFSFIFFVSPHLLPKGILVAHN